MSDGQDKSDDLIAELAKLMASSAGGAEPEAKPGPKLVSAPEPQAVEPRPAGPTIRIPGMDAPVAATQQPTPVPSAEKPASAAPTIRIPGMDQPVAAPPRPAAPAPAPVVADEAKPVAARPAEVRVPSIDFGTLPAAATIRPEPLSNWQDREIPKPVAARPPVASEPVLTPPAPAPRPAISAPVAAAVSPASTSTAPPAPTPVKLDEAEAAAKSDEPVVVGKPAPAGDSFDFDFGFGNNPPPPIGEQPRPANPPAPTPAAESDDPIADLIAAELDAAEDEAPAPAPVPARPPVQPPAIRSFPAAAAPQQQRAVTTNPVRPPVAPPVAAAPQPKPASEPDRFATAPVFGVGGKPSAAPAPAERDPMDEIESLIGEAVRVELSAPEKPVPAERPAKPATAPVVPPLTTQFAPRRAAIKDTEPQIASAEAAILAAAAASGADLGRVEGPTSAEAPSPYKRPKAKPEKRRFLSGGMRQYIGMAVAGTLLLAAGFGLYWVLGMNRGTDAEAPVLTADATPVKEVPPAAPPKEDAQGSVVFNELGGGSATPPADEQLVSRDDSTDTSVADVAQTVGDGEGAVDNESELANRKVRTVTVRPDGTIVSGDDAVAGSEALPVDRPNVPEVPGADVQPSELLAALPDTTAPAPATTDPVADAIDAASTGTADPAATAAAEPANIDPTIVAPVPMPRPSNRAALSGRVASTDASAPLDLTASNTPAAAPRAPAVSSAGGAYVQLSSQPTTDDAQASLRITQNRLAGILNGRSLEIRQVDLGAKGVWYRVVLPVNSFSEATQTCASFKANGTDCVPING